MVVRSKNIYFGLALINRVPSSIRTGGPLINSIRPSLRLPEGGARVAEPECGTGNPSNDHHCVCPFIPLDLLICVNNRRCRNWIKF